MIRTLVVRFSAIAAVAAVAVVVAGVWPAPTEGLASESAASSVPLVVCLGDSLTEGLGVSPEQAYPALVEQRLRQIGWPMVEVVNAGISGATSASAVSRLKWQLRRKPDVLLLALGANDGLRGVDLASTKRNLADAIDLAIANDIAVLLAGMRLPPNYGPAYTDEFESLFADLAKEKKVALIPFLLKDVAADPTLNFPDGIHPNERGYEIVAGTVTVPLSQLLQKVAPSGRPPSQPPGKREPAKPEPTKPEPEQRAPAERVSDALPSAAAHPSCIDGLACQEGRA